jgi:hypothetical protein
MNCVIKSIAVIAIISFCLSACGGESSGESSGAMPSGGLDTSLLSDTAKRGHAIYVDPAYGNILTDCATNVAKYMENGYQVQ